MIPALIALVLILGAIAVWAISRAAFQADVIREQQELIDAYRARESGHGL